MPLPAHFPLEVHVGGVAVATSAPKAVERPLLERAVASAKIAAMLQLDESTMP